MPRLVALLSLSLAPALAVGCLPSSCGVGADPLLGQPAPWAWQMEHFTVDPDRGRRWELDEGWVMPMASVPAPVILPDGRYGMFYSNMREMGSRPLLVSDDGLNWQGQPFSRWSVDLFPQYCGNRLEDVAPWVRSPDTYHLVFMGHFDQIAGFGELPPDGDSATRLCHGTTTDLQHLEAADHYLWRGQRPGEDNSVFSVLSTAAGKGLFFYVGDVGRTSDEGEGIRAIAVDATTLAVEQVIGEPLLPATVVDPHAVFLEGGGVRIYGTNLANQRGGVVPGVIFQDLDERLRPVGRMQQAIVSPGHCALGPDWTCGCVLDPAYLRLGDGSMVIYTGFLEEVEGQECSLNIRRFHAVD